MLSIAVILGDHDAADTLSPHPPLSLCTITEGQDMAPSSPLQILSTSNGIPYYHEEHVFRHLLRDEQILGSRGRSRWLVRSNRHTHTHTNTPIELHDAPHTNFFFCFFFVSRFISALTEAKEEGGVCNLE